MSLIITKKNVKQIKCDAIVVWENGSWSQQCNCFVVRSIINQPYNAIIYATKPAWNDIESYKQGLKSMYTETLQSAINNNYQSIAIPVIDQIDCGCDDLDLQKRVIKIINNFLLFNEITVYLAVSGTRHGNKSPLYSEILKHIREVERKNHINYSSMSIRPCLMEESFYKITPKRKSSEIEELIGKLDDSFALTLMKLMDKKGMTEVECYKKANVSKQTWYKILNDKKYKPSRNTIIAFAISLELTFDETQELLSTVGFTLSTSSKFDIIITYFIKKGIYDIMLINESLFDFDQPCLGV